MKVLFVLSALAAVALAKPGVIAPAAVSPLAYNGFYNHLGYSNLGYSSLGYSNLGYSNLGYSNLGYNYAGLPYATTAYAAAPAVATTYAAAPIAHAVPAVTKTQYHAQDELGQASYGYAHPGQVHNAVRDAFGNVAGSYSYVDPNGKVVKTDYIADGAGFRVASNALPVAPAVPIAPAVALPVGPAPVQDTPEVVEARIAHLAEVAAVKSRSKRGVLAYNAPIAAAYPYAAYPYAHAYGAAVPAISSYAAHTYAAPALSYAAHTYAAPALSYAASPLAVSAVPAVRAATLTTVVNNPGHAVSYRVD